MNFTTEYTEVTEKSHEKKYLVIHLTKHGVLFYMFLSFIFHKPGNHRGLPLHLNYDIDRKP